MINAGFMRFLGNMIKRELRKLDRRIIGKETSEKLHGYFLVVLEFGDESGPAHFITDADQRDVIKVLRRTADLLEGGNIQGTREDN